MRKKKKKKGLESGTGSPKRDRRNFHAFQMKKPGRETGWGKRSKTRGKKSRSMEKVEKSVATERLKKTKKEREALSEFHRAEAAESNTRREQHGDKPVKQRNKRKEGGDGRKKKGQPG